VISVNRYILFKMKHVSYTKLVPIWLNINDFIFR